MGAFKFTAMTSPELEAFQREWPRKLARAMAIVVNDAAADMRDEMELSIGRLMTIRSKTFVKNHLRVKKARSGGRSPVAEVGSIRRGKFEGWAGQQFGADVERERVPTLMSRGGTKTKSMKNASRLMKGRDIPTAREIAGKSGPGSVIAMMRILARRGDRRPFLIFPGEHPKFQGGLYEMRGRKDKGGRKAKLSMLQGLENPNTQPRRVDWVNPAWQAYQRGKSIAGAWVRAFNLVGWRDVMRRAR